MRWVSSKESVAKGAGWLTRLQRETEDNASSCGRRALCATFSALSTLTEIENAVATLSRREQQTLLQHLSAKLQVRAVAAGTGRRKRWPVPPPKVSKTESQRITRCVEGEFGRVEREHWK